MSGSFPINAKCHISGPPNGTQVTWGCCWGCSENYAETFFAMSLVMQKATTISVRASCLHTSEGAACH